MPLRSLTCKHSPPRRSHAALPALSCSGGFQPIQSSKAPGSFVSQMARRRRRGESWRGTLCGYLETRKQKELGGGWHMSARAKPQERSGERGVAMRRSWCWDKTGQWRLARRNFRCGSAAGLVEAWWYTRANGRPSTLRIWRCSPAQITPGRTAIRDFFRLAPWTQGLRQAGQMQACSALARIRRTPSGHRARCSIGVADSLSASYGLPPLTSSRCEMVSSKLVTLPLGPESKIEGKQVSRGKSPGPVWGRRMCRAGDGMSGWCLASASMSTTTRRRARSMGGPRGREENFRLGRFGHSHARAQMLRRVWWENVLQDEALGSGPGEHHSTPGARSSLPSTACN
jgi:hypothetical protein